jgi:ELWxxDGT repeat protein
MDKTGSRPTVVESLEGRRLFSVQLVADVNTDTLSSNPREFVSLGGKALFFAKQPDGKYGLWGTDGTSGGTALLRSDLGGLPTLGGAFGLVAADGLALFTTKLAGSPFQLWSTDGTAAGTRQLAADLKLGAQAVSFGGRTYFPATSTAGGTELWSTDGTPEGTVVFADLAPGAAGSNARALTVSGQYLYFRTTQTPDFLTVLWRTDGTPQGLLRLHEMQSYVPAVAASLNGKLLFADAPPGGAADQLWESDGTVAGTRMVADTSPIDRSNLGDFAVMGGALYFGAPYDDNGHLTLWRSDGTAGGTAQVVPGGTMDPGRLITSGPPVFPSERRGGRARTVAERRHRWRDVPRRRHLSRDDQWGHGALPVRSARGRRRLLCRQGPGL